MDGKNADQLAFEDEVDRLFNDYDEDEWLDDPLPERSDIDFDQLCDELFSNPRNSDLDEESSAPRSWIHQDSPHDDLVLPESHLEEESGTDTVQAAVGAGRPYGATQITICTIWGHPYFCCIGGSIFLESEVW